MSAITSVTATHRKTVHNFDDYACTAVYTNIYLIFFISVTICDKSCAVYKRKVDIYTVYIYLQRFTDCGKSIVIYD